MQIITLVISKTFIGFRPYNERTSRGEVVNKFQGPSCFISPSVSIGMQPQVFKHQVFRKSVRYLVHMCSGNISVELYPDISYDQCSKTRENIMARIRF